MAEMIKTNKLQPLVPTKDFSEWLVAHLCSCLLRENLTKTKLLGCTFTHFLGW